MAGRMEGPIRGGLIGIFISAAAAFGSLPAEAQDAPPLSPSCAAPSVDIAAPAPLPRVAQRLANGGPLRILAIGSSSTWGIGASSGRQAYPAQLKAILDATLRGIDAEIINRGGSGEVAEATAERLRTEVALQKPDLVLWQLGTNDALSRVPPEDFEHTVHTTVAWLKSNNIDVVLVGLQYTPSFARDENYFAIRDALQRVSVSENVLYVRRYDAMAFIAKHQGDVGRPSQDGFHLDDLGYYCMAEHVAHAVIVNLFLHHRDLPRDRPAAPPNN